MSPSETMPSEAMILGVGYLQFFESDKQKFPQHIQELVDQVSRESFAKNLFATTKEEDLSELEKKLLNKPDVIAKIRKILAYAEQNSIGTYTSSPNQLRSWIENQTIFPLQAQEETTRAQEHGSPAPVPNAAKRAGFAVSLVADLHKAAKITQLFVSPISRFSKVLFHAIAGLSMPISSFSLYGAYRRIDRALCEGRVAYRHRDYEGGALSVLRGSSGLGTAFAGATALVGGGASIGSRALLIPSSSQAVASRISTVTASISKIAGPALYAALALYSAYRVVKEFIFGFQLHAVFMRTDRTEQQSIADTLKWLKAQVTFDPFEALEIKAQATKSGKDADQALREGLHRKWDSFARRTSEETCKKVREALATKESDLLIKKVESGDRKSIDEACGLIGAIAKENYLKVVKYLVILVAAVIGIVFATHPGFLIAALALKVLFVLATQSYLAGNLSGLYMKLADRLWTIGDEKKKQSPLTVSPQNASGPIPREPWTFWWSRL